LPKTQGGQRVLRQNPRRGKTTNLGGVNNNNHE